VDELRRLDDAARGQDTAPMVAPSQGVHLVVDRSFMPADEALLVPRTRDGRVLFAVPPIPRATPSPASRGRCPRKSPSS
jgi:glycerol-3-phosphate dehydrogenase